MRAPFQALTTKNSVNSGCQNNKPDGLPEPAPGSARQSGGSAAVRGGISRFSPPNVFFGQGMGLLLLE